MFPIAPVLTILLANLVNSDEINVAALGSEFADRGEVDLALQIRQMPTTSEATPAAASGNDLDTTKVLGENQLAISAIHSEDETGAKKEDGVKGNGLFAMPLDGNQLDTEDKSKLNKINIFSALPLVWDGCVESASKDTKNILKIQQIDMENEKIIKEENKRNYYPNSWNKRNVNNSEVLKALDKHDYHETTIVRKSKDRRYQRKSVLNKITDATSIPTAVHSETITKDIFREHSTTKINTSTEKSEEMLFESNDIKVRLGQAEDWFEVKDRTKIRFGGPRTNNYLIPSLELESVFNPFGFIADFFTLIYPYELPSGLIKDIFWGNFAFPYSFLQTIKLESAFLGFIIAFICIALVIPSYLFILCILCLMTKSNCGDDTETGNLFPEAEDTDCNDRVVVVVTLFLILLCCMLVSGMAVSNEQASSAASMAREVASCACADLATWVVTAAQELHNGIVPPADAVVQVFKDDLRNVDTLLGEPIQEAIASESGINLVLDSLKDIVNESEDVSSKISALRDLSNRAGTMASSITDKVRDLARQLDNLKKNCNFKDAPLCDTINTNSLEVSMRFDLILREHRLLELRSLGVGNLTKSISTAKQQLRALSTAVVSQTSAVREAILRDIEFHRQEVHSASRVLSDIARHLSATLYTGMRKLDSSLERVLEYEFWRWSFMLACVVFFGFVMLMMLLAIVCGCGRAKGHAKRTLQLSTLWMCIASLILWTVISALFIISGHAEVFICRALWEYPNYKTLSALLDRPSPLFSNDEGVFDALLRDLENVTIDVSVTDILRDCERNQPAYSVFGLDTVLDVDKETSYFEWADLQTDLNKLSSSIDVGFLKTLSKYFYKLLSAMLEISDVNLASYRMDYNGAIVGKDLPSLAEQLENVAAQVTDLTTAGRLETLATRTQRLHMTSVKPLEQLRAELVFKLTELELQLLPFRRKLNISLSHIHTAQYYIDNQGDVIAEKKASAFVSRLVSHASGWRTHVLEATEKRAARCGPLFDVFAGLRGLMCSSYIASLHGWWLCGTFLGILWCTALTPLCITLWRAYGRKIIAADALALANLTTRLLNEIPPEMFPSRFDMGFFKKRVNRALKSRQRQQDTPTTALCESSNWNMPGPPPPPSNESW